MLVHRLFEDRVAQQPDRIAIVADADSATFQQVNDRSNRLAHLLVSLGVARQTRVAVCLSRGIDSIVALLGVLKAGGTCIPIDPDYPSDRQTLITTEARAAYVVTEGRLEERFQHSGTHPIAVDRQSERLTAAPSSNPAAIADPSDLAYILYTSGSSGRPKGVEIEQHALADNATKTARLLRLTQSDRMLQFASISFASSMGQIFAPLVIGARLVMRTNQYSAAQVIKYVRENEITVLWLTPSVIRYLTERPDLSIAQLSHPLRLLRSGGELLTLDLMRRWFSQSSVPLLNVYGPTEAVQDITAREYTSVPRIVTIGRPIFDAEVYVLDPAGRPVTEGVEGELYLSSPGMARGYLDQPDLTAERFVRLAIGGETRRLYRTGDVVRQLGDGQLEYRGRRDNQVKLHGFRVELGEVEARLGAHDEVVAAAAVLSTSDAGDTSLTAYYVLDEDLGDRKPNLLRWCAQALPMHMVPTRYVRVPRLPLTANGKLDREALVRFDGETSP